MPHLKLMMREVGPSVPSAAAGSCATMRMSKKAAEVVVGMPGLLGVQLSPGGLRADEALHRHRLR
jgi:hypothetical protein